MREARCVEHAELTHAPLDLLVDFSAQANEQTLQVLLNGNDVTSAFALSPAGGRPPAGGGERRVGRRRAARRQPADGARAGGHADEAVPGLVPDAGDPYGDAVVSYTVGQNGGYPGTNYLPGIVTGPPEGSGLFQGGLDVFSLGFGGSIVLRFDDNAIADEPGPDFTVFENAFLAFNAATLTIERPFADPGRVAVSQNGTTWYEFPCSLTTNPATGVFYPGCAGVYPVLSNANDAARRTRRSRRRAASKT